MDYRYPQVDGIEERWDEMLTVQAITVDPMGRTGVPGLFAAGDAATAVPPSMAAAVASGYLAGAAAVVQLAAGS